MAANATRNRAAKKDLPSRNRLIAAPVHGFVHRRLWSGYDFGISRAFGRRLFVAERLDGTEQKGIDVSLRRALWSLDGLRDGSGRNRRRAVAIVGSIAVVRYAFRSGSNKDHKLVHGDDWTIEVRPAANVAVVNHRG